MQGPNRTFFYPSSIFHYSLFQEHKEAHVPLSLLTLNGTLSGNHGLYSSKVFMCNKWHPTQQQMECSRSNITIHLVKRKSEN
jgi:hypothetical protein